MKIKDNKHITNNKNKKNMEKKLEQLGKIVLAFERNNGEGQLKKIYTSDMEEDMLQDMISFMEQDVEVSIDYFEEDSDLIDVLEYREFCTKEESKEDCGIEWEKTEKTMNDILNITDPVRLEANKLLNDLNNSINNC